MKTLRILVLAALSAVSLHAAAQRAPVPVMNFENIPVSAAASADKVKQAIQSAATARQWEVREEAPGRMVATLHVRGKHTVVTDILYSPTSFSLKYRDSVNMKYSPGADGRGMIHPFYNRWVEDLKEAIRANINRS
ncbi:MAG: hypothetical protein HYX47_06090 [Burkholderiales bacterium]|nr:hypothetical protein [Burkholderiales bacterium]